MDRMEDHFAAGMPPARYPWGSADPTPVADVTIAFWCACHGGQRHAAEYLLKRGADRDWASSWDGLTPLAAARRRGAEDVANWLRTLGAQ